MINPSTKHTEMFDNKTVEKAIKSLSKTLLQCPSVANTFFSHYNLHSCDTILIKSHYMKKSIMDKSPLNAMWKRPIDHQ